MAFLLVAATALGPLGCDDPADRLYGTTTPGDLTTVTHPPGHATTVRSPAFGSDATSPDMWVMTTSAESYAFSQEAMEAALQLGDAAIDYLGGQVDLATVQSLAAPSAQNGLAQMLQLLEAPTDCVVNSTAYTGGSNVVDVQLWFADGKSQNADFIFTAVIDPEETTITAIVPSGSPDPSVDSGVIYLSPGIMYLSPVYSFYHAEAVVLGTVIEALPHRLNPLAGSENPDGSNGHEAVAYKGYVLGVEKAWGPGSMPRRITIYALGNGTLVRDGETQEVREEFPLDAGLGDRLLVPLMKLAYFGTPELQPHEYWVQSNAAVYEVHDDGRCTRVTGMELDPESGHEFPLSELESIAVERGKAPSAVE